MEKHKNGDVAGPATSNIIKPSRLKKSPESCKSIINACTKSPAIKPIKNGSNLNFFIRAGNLLA
jgi:hypothetical protein